MSALLLALVLFLVLCAIGVAGLSLLGSDTADLRLALAAPAFGSAVALLPLFVASRLGFGMDQAALPVLAGVGVLSLIVLVIRRPSVPVYALPVLGVCVAHLVLVGRPMLDYGFNWIANANDDMAGYVLAATSLLHRGLMAHFDVTALAHDRDWASAYQAQQLAGVRPGANILLAGIASGVRRPPYDLYMPVTLALNLCGICGAGALALQATRRWIAAVLAAVLVAVAPLATYGVTQQLLPQVWGLALASVLLALSMYQDEHLATSAVLRRAAVLGILVAAVVLVYVELASTLAVAYALYLTVVLARRTAAIGPVVRLWLPVAAIVCLVLNTYLVRELEFVATQATFGLKPSGEIPLFGYSLIPSALPAVLGLDTIAPRLRDGELSVAIVVSIAVFAVALVLSVASALRARAAAIALVTYAFLGVVLATKSSDFGLFKLYMYVQPFLAAAAAVWIAGLSKRLVILVIVPLVLLFAIQVGTQWRYVEDSRNPIDLAYASSPALLPAFQRLYDVSPERTVSVTENPVMAKMEAARVDRGPLHLVSRDLFSDVLTGYASSAPSWVSADAARVRRAGVWRTRTFDLMSPNARGAEFRDNTRSSSLLSSRRCRVIFPTGNELPFNRLSFPETTAAHVIAQSCSTTRNLLAFTQSTLGESFYLFIRRKNVSFYQLEKDYFRRGHTFAGFGRYALFRVIGPSKPFRVELDFTTTLRQDGSNTLPPAAVVGASRVTLPLVGRGSARVYSRPVEPQVIAGQPYLLLDMGRPGSLLNAPRGGVQGLYGRSIPLDGRFLTSYVRDVSLVTDGEYHRLAAPGSLQRFPADLFNPALEYSGIYEDGWIGEKSALMLAGGVRARLLIRAQVLPRHVTLRIAVNSRTVFSRRVEGGSRTISVPIPASSSRRRILLKWGTATRLPTPDLRPVVAHLNFIGIVRR